MSSVLVVGSVALDSVETPFGKAEEVLGGSATFFSASASLLAPVQLVGIVGRDYPVERLEPLKERGVNLSGLECADGESFHWRGRYRHDLNSAETIETTGDWPRSARTASETTEPSVVSLPVDVKSATSILSRSRSFPDPTSDLSGPMP